jgi:hypothetical protein
MTRFQSCLSRNKWKSKPGILLAVVVIASTSVLLAVPSPAFAKSGGAKTSSVFGGYIKTLRGLLRGDPKESAQANFTVPTLTCNEESDQALLITQDLNYDQGALLEPYVMAECDSGTATYNAAALQCGIDGVTPPAPAVQHQSQSPQAIRSR